MRVLGAFPDELADSARVESVSGMVRAWLILAAALVLAGIAAKAVLPPPASFGAGAAGVYLLVLGVLFCGATMCVQAAWAALRAGSRSLAGGRRPAR